MESELQKLQRYYSALYPEREGLTVSNFVPLDSGWECDVAAFHASWQEDGRAREDDLVLRVYGAGEIDKATREFHALRGLKAAGYPVPRTDHLEVEHLVEGRPFLVMERAPGETMWRTMFQGSQQEQQRNIDIFCELLVRLHALDWRRFTAHPEEYTPERLLDRAFAEWEPYIHSAQQTGFQTVWNWIQQHRPAIQPYPPAVLHWDFHPNNILVSEDGTATVLDWTSFAINDPRFDIAWTLIVMLPHEGPGWRARLLEAYQRISGTPIQDLEFFEVACALRRLFSVYISLTLGADQLGMRAEAAAQIHSQLLPLRSVADFLYERSGLRIPEFDALMDHENNLHS